MARVDDLLDKFEFGGDDDLSKREMTRLAAASALDKRDHARGIQTIASIDSQKLRNKGALDTQGLANTGAVNTQELRNTGAMDTQGLRNKGALDVQGLREEGYQSRHAAASGGEKLRAGVARRNALIPNWQTTEDIQGNITGAYNTKGQENPYNPGGDSGPGTNPVEAFIDNAVGSGSSVPAVQEPEVAPQQTQVAENNNHAYTQPIQQVEPQNVSGPILPVAAPANTGQVAAQGPPVNRHPLQPNANAGDTSNPPGESFRREILGLDNPVAQKRRQDFMKGFMEKIKNPRGAIDYTKEKGFYSPWVKD